jgi:ribonuclease J
MNEEKKTHNLDKWLQKNVTHSKDVSSNKKSKFSFRGRKPKKDKLKIIPLGGLNEVGKNMMLIEYGDDMIVIDMGLLFPEDDLLGVDYIVPDITYLQKNQHKLRGILITHGHLDHIGAISYLAPKLKDPKFYGLPLTMGMVQKKISEYKRAKKSVNTFPVQPRKTFRLGCFKVTFYRVNHSIPDSAGVIIETPEGFLVHTGDFKFDATPADNLLADTDIMELMGSKNVLALLSDSTNATKPGETVSEKVVGEALDEIISNTDGRIIIASFASLIGRMQQIIDSAQKNGRKIFVTGRSMKENIKLATKMGYIKYPKGLVQELRQDRNKESHLKNALILTTGSQGESLAALTRMAMNEHPKVKIMPSDTVVYSSSPIVGNERAITAVINEITRKGARVITNKHMDIHTTGHGHQEDLKRMINYIKPKYFIPVHGEYYMRCAHRDLAIAEGIPKENTFVIDNGNIIEVENGKMSISKRSLPDKFILVDNQSNVLAGIATHIVSERQAMSLNGVVIVTANIDSKTGKLKSAKTESHGFIFMRSTEKVLEEITRDSIEAYNQLHDKQDRRITSKEAAAELKQVIDRNFMRRIQRRPLVVPIINEV